MIKWDHVYWLDRYHTPSRDRDHFRALRREVFQSTLEIVEAGGYRSVSGLEVELDREAILRAQKDAVFHPDTRKIRTPGKSEGLDTRAYSIDADCLEVNRLLQVAGFNPAVLNLANRHNPGGGVLGGSGAQEENLFRRSTAFRSLYQFVDYCAQYEIDRNQDFSYPIPSESGGIYTPDLIVFRSSEKTGYFLLDVPYRLNLISVAAISGPELEQRGEQLRIVSSLVEPTKERIRAILRIGKAHGHDALVLGAWGCGAFANPPEHMAVLFREVISEEEFKQALRLIVFAVMDDHNTHKFHNPQGNAIPFQVGFNE